jgi:hypothetical protein
MKTSKTRIPARAWAAVAAVLAVALLAPALASGLAPAGAETRVWGSRVEIAAGIGAERSVSETGIRGYGPRYDELAVGYPLVPRGTTLRHLGTDAWESAAGLRYVGRDPAGLTRVSHVLRHAADDVTRPVHGVLDAGRRGALRVVDDAWIRIQQQGIQGVTQGNRTVFTVDMGGRVGYLGGQAGASAGNPALTRLQIVVERGTSNVVTAFPVQ